MACDGKAGGQQHTAHVQRISRVGVWPRKRQLFVLAEMPRGVSAHQQPNRGDPHSAKKPFRLRARKTERRDANRVSHTNSPANPEICPGAHAGAFTQEFAASKTCSTVIRSIAGEYDARRL